MEFVVVGCRGFGRYHLDALTKTEVEVSIVERSQKVRETILQEYDILNSYASFDEALQSGAEVVDLVVPHNLHSEMAVKALNSGKHVLVEKPIANTLEDARKMVDAASAADRKLMVADQYYFDPAVTRIRDSIARNEIGNVHTIIIRDQSLRTPVSWRADIKLNGGGALMDGGIHFIDTMLNIGGEYGSLRSTVYRGNPHGSVEDTSLTVFDFTSGARGILFYSWAYPGVLKAPSYEIAGDDGLIIEDLGTKPKKGFRGLRGMRAYGDPIVNNRLLQIGDFDVFYAEIQGFIESIENKTPVPFPPELAIRDLEAVLRIYDNSS